MSDSKHMGAHACQTVNTPVTTCTGSAHRRCAGAEADTGLACWRRGDSSVAGTGRFSRRRGPGQITKGLSHGGEFGLLYPVLTGSRWSVCRRYQICNILNFTFNMFCYKKLVLCGRGCGHEGCRAGLVRPGPPRGLSCLTWLVSRSGSPPRGAALASHPRPEHV